MNLQPLNNEPFAPTSKNPGDRVIHGHKAYRVLKDGAWQDLDRQPVPVLPSIAAPVFHRDAWKGVLVALAFTVVFLTILAAGSR